MLTIVTASTSLQRAEMCLRSWIAHASQPLELIIVLNGPEAAGDISLGGDLGASIIASGEYLGTVRAFQIGTQAALAKGDQDQIIACFHDDLLITEHGWDDKVLEFFRRHPACGLLGFGGAIGLGDEDLYQKPYSPHQLARIGFRSNMQGAELHGIRSTWAERVACLDSFSMIFRSTLASIVWNWLEQHKVVHHFHDGIAACLAARYKYEVWYLPLLCHHYGGRTAVGDQGYQGWAKQQNGLGDEEFWRRAHEIGYREFRDVLPIRV